MSVKYGVSRQAATVWVRSSGCNRQIKSSKTCVVDSGMLAHLIGADERRIVDDGVIAGTMLESFVAMELLRQADWADRPVQLFHYRDKQQREVDVIIERHDGDVVGIEVKASATPSTIDFTGLRYLRDKLGRRFKAGVVLHTGADTLPFGDRLAAVPVIGSGASADGQASCQRALQTPRPSPSTQREGTTNFPETYK